MKLVITGTLPNLNDYVGANRRNRFKGAKLKQDTEYNIKMQLKNQIGRIAFDKPVMMDYLWIEPNRMRDKDNISAFGRKCIQDSLVDLGVIDGDGWRHIVGFTDSFEIDKDNPRIEIIITEV